MTGFSGVLSPQVGLWAQEGRRRGSFINTCSGLHKCSEVNRRVSVHLAQANHQGFCWNRTQEVTGLSTSQSTRGLLGDKIHQKRKRKMDFKGSLEKD